MKTKSSIKRICKNCKIIKRNKKLINLCIYGAHKQKQ